MELSLSTKNWLAGKRQQFKPLGPEVERTAGWLGPDSEPLIVVGRSRPIDIRARADGSDPFILPLGWDVPVERSDPPEAIMCELGIEDFTTSDVPAPKLVEVTASYDVYTASRWHDITRCHEAIFHSRVFHEDECVCDDERFTLYHFIPWGLSDEAGTLFRPPLVDWYTAEWCDVGNVVFSKVNAQVPAESIRHAVLRPDFIRAVAKKTRTRIWREAKAAIERTLRDAEQVRA